MNGMPQPAQPSSERGELQEPTLRRQLEAAIREARGDTRQAAINVCFILEDQFGFGEDGYFDDDPELIELHLSRDDEEDE